MTDREKKIAEVWDVEVIKVTEKGQATTPKRRRTEDYIDFLRGKDIKENRDFIAFLRGEEPREREE